MSLRPYENGRWSSLPSGALVWFEDDMPRRVLAASSTGWRQVIDELGTLTGQRYRLGLFDAFLIGWQAQVFP